MPSLVFPPSSSPGENPQEGAGQIINCYVEKLADGARAPARHRRCPGLRTLATAPDSRVHTRGFIDMNTPLIHVLNARVVKVTVSGSTYTSADVGSLAGTTPVTLARNNKSPTPDIQAVTENGAFNIFTGSAPTSFADADLPAPNSVAELGGYFLWTIGDGRIFASALNDITVASNSFTTEQERPGTLLRGISFRGEFFAFKTTSCGVYTNEGLTPFPLTRRLMIRKGLLGQWAIAGWEPGWASELIWVGDDRVVHRLNGYTPEPISTDDVNRDIASVTDTTTIKASVFMTEGHPMWALTCDDWTLVYDLATRQWHQRASYLDTRWRAEQTVNAFGKWMAGDELTGKFFQIDSSYRKEDTEPLIVEATCVPIQGFPARLFIPRLDINLVPGVGDATGADTTEINPSVLISVSLDGGVNFGTPWVRKLGVQGKTKTKISVLRCGLTTGMGVQVKVKMSDPAHFGLMGGSIAIDGRAA